MSIKPFLEFDHQKATQAINFFACKENGEINRLKVLKLIWAADRYHLRKYGRPIINDSYWALPHGPVASATKDITEDSDVLSDEERSYAAQYIRPEDRHTITSLQEPDLGVFSDTDIEALEFAYKEFGQLDKYKVRDVTHLYPEWKKFEKHLIGTSRVSMNYLDFFENPQGEQHDAFSESNELLQLTKEKYVDSCATAGLFAN